MDYLFENLGDERFQEFCTCLISKEFPNVQAFPVGQPDGGRDAISYYMTSPKKDFIIFQVKYVKNPYKITEVHKWLTDIINGELDKIDKLIPKGAKSYYLITNVPGTAHLDFGSIDKVNNLLETKIKIPAICWWRDDVVRLIDKDPLFKWSYPEILDGQSILNNYLFRHLNENKERREDVIRAYLIDQYKQDNEVKFKQIDLQSRLFKLFIDLPIKPKKLDENKIHKYNYTAPSQTILFKSTFNKDVDFEDNEEHSFGAAYFLLQKDFNKIMIEGGPGQGKSTISQYVCQVHRVRLLDNNSDIQLLPKNIRNSPIRLPFKIDLRHVADWVEKKNPYINRINDIYFNQMWQDSLESFLIAHIFLHSKIEMFSIADFLAISNITPILFVFDGFDEIANINIREQVIDFINKGIERINVNSNSVQVIITSRPAVFSESISFSTKLYPHFELGDLTPSLTSMYVEKWISANRLDENEAIDIRKLILEKIEVPHLKELVKNPMQLAIFISLLRTRGASLPDKRTALYDSYIEYFFNREAEKHNLVRDHRDLIIELHQYLAWILHSEAELYNRSGIIDIENLKAKINNYLKKEGHQVDITDQLFDVVKERVCALVSRVQGTFEFEVQPLREYFCAKFLYNTSPYSPTGEEKKGTIPERFDAIAKNFYWNNVVRFFTGCFNKGELPLLLLKLQELQNDNNYKCTCYPETLTAQILADWVFKQYPKLISDVVNIITSGIKAGIFIHSFDNRLNSNSIILPKECGGNEIVKECYGQLLTFPNDDYSFELIRILRDNPYNLVENWNNFGSKLEGSKLTKWLEYAYSLRIIESIEYEILIKILEENQNELINRLQILIDANREDIIYNNKKYKNLLLDYLLNNDIYYFPYTNWNHNILTLVGGLLNQNFLKSVLKGDNLDVTLINYFCDWLNQYTNLDKQELSIDSFNKIKDGFDRPVFDFITSISPLLTTNIMSFQKSINKWDFLVEEARRCFNNAWILNIVAVFAASIKSRSEIYEGYSDLSNSSSSLCKRVRCARMKSGNINYWDKQLTNSSDIVFTLFVLFSWATCKTIINLQQKLIHILYNIKECDFIKLYESINICSHLSPFSYDNEQELIRAIKINNFSNSFLLLISPRIPINNRNKFIYENISEETCIYKNIAEAKFNYLIEEYLLQPNNIEILNKIKESYNSLPKYGALIIPNLFFRVKKPQITYEIAIKIMRDARNYPRIIVLYAENTCLLYAFNSSKPVGEIALNEKWF